MKPLHLVLLVVMNAFWAGTYSSFKALTAELSAGQVATLRYTLAALLVGVLWRFLPGQAPRGRDLLRAGVMGALVFSLSPRLQIWGVQMGKAGDSSVVVALEPLVTAVLAGIFLREHISWRRWTGFLLGMSGVILLNGAWRLEIEWVGLGANLVFLTSFVCEAAYSVIGKPLCQRAGLMKLVGVALFSGTCVNLLLDGAGTVSRLARISPVQWLVVAYLAVICTVIGYAFWFVVIRETDVSLAALTILVQPLFGVFIAAAFLGEPLHAGQLWGILAILGGLAVGFRDERVTEVAMSEPGTDLPHEQTVRDRGQLP